MFNTLHTLLQTKRHETTVEEVQALIDKYPHWLEQKTEFNQLPLHIAIDDHAPVEVIKLLIKEYPDSVKVTDRHGRLSLLIAAITVRRWNLLN